MDPQCKASLRNLELKFHDELFNWIIAKSPKITSPDLLDISSDECIFSGILASRLKPGNFVVALRGQNPIKLDLEKIQIKQINLSAANLGPSLATLGKFDILILKDVLHEVTDLASLFRALSLNLKSKDSRIFILSRPKSPPVPIPDSALVIWRKIALTREQLIQAAEEAGLTQELYTASCPIQVDRQEWANVLKGGSIVAVKQSPKCTEREINEFLCVGVPGKGQLVFEEKYFILCLQAK